MTSGQRGRRRERGAAMVEAAIITPVFFLLLFGVVEFGLLFRDSLTTNNAAHQGARAASVHGADPDTDYLIIRAIEHGLMAGRLQDLEYVVVFRATGPDSVMPPVCATASRDYNPATPTAPACNRYTAADFFLEIEDPVSGADTGNFRCSTSSVDRFWCPFERDTDLSGGTDYLGVHVQTSHGFITGMFGNGLDLGETSIVRLEAEES